jgi:hypothetical protein
MLLAEGWRTARAREPDQDAVAVRLRDVLAHAREELDRADHKAEVLLAASGVITGAGLVLQWRPPVTGGLDVVWWFGVLAWVGGITGVAASVVPRIRPHPGRQAGQMLFFGDVQPGVSPGRLIAVTQRNVDTSAHPDRDWAADQLIEVSRIVRSKYRLLRSGCLGLGIGVVLVALAGLMDNRLR